jgi:hypothetical protein
VETDFVGQTKKVEQNIEQRNLNKPMILRHSLNIILTCRHLFLHSVTFKHQSKDADIYDRTTQVVTSKSHT